ncbi:MAG: YccF domain-containing protein [Gammaproteobacteria bacterium]|nr:YccF domain-containing protein [Gammaproteobacteria bacterium]
MRLLGNLIWLLFGGLATGIGWWVAGLLAAITIIGIPFAIAAFRIGTFSFWPFGREVVDRPERDEARKLLILLGNIVWILLGGIWLALAHLFFALLLAITIIGIPFAVQHLKLAQLSLTPYGKMIVVREPASSLSSADDR